MRWVRDQAIRTLKVCGQSFRNVQGLEGSRVDENLNETVGSPNESIGAAALAKLSYQD
jgi:hypothetical protein